jgi:subtilisin family serine protease
VLAVICALVALAVPAGAAPGSAGPEYVEGRYIVVLENGAAAGAVADLHEAVYGVGVTHVYRTALKGYAAAMPASVAQTIESLPGVEWVEQDKVVRASAQTLPTGINRVDADLSPSARINGLDERVDVDVAVIDTGVSLNHPDLNVNAAGGRNCQVSLLSANDGNGHGSHVAGTIGALDNAAGVVGVAPGARIWPVKVLDDVLGAGLNSHIICGIDYVASRSAEIEVANMSLGGGGSDDGNCGNTNGDAEHRAICTAVSRGITFVVAAGNESSNAASSTPAAYDEVITVSAISDFNGTGGGGAAATCTSDQDDTFANYSNFGADIDLAAPGTCIYSTYSGSGYATISGTSMASPHVAGAAALYKAANPGATPAQVKAALQSAGTLDWIYPSQDRDGIQERLLNVSSF